jgi:hypothetical protein
MAGGRKGKQNSNSVYFDELSSFCHVMDVKTHCRGAEDFGKSDATPALKFHFVSIVNSFYRLFFP